MLAEALAMMQRVEARSLDRLLRGHVEDGEIEEHLQGLLILAVTAGTAERDERFAVAEHDRRAERRAWPLAAPHDVGMPLVEDERLHAVAERHAGVARDEGATREPG